MDGVVFDIQKFSLNDGRGIRTTVFLKGCPLRCAWCSNPESQAAGRQRAFWRARCIGCGRCAAACPSGLGRDRPGHALCGEDCHRCVAACPAAALRSVGRTISVEELLDIVRRDSRAYYRSGGGVTFSGGEALTQWRFVREASMRLRDMLTDTALETCGHAPWEEAWAACEPIDHILFDIKHLDPEPHREFTGRDNALILSNLRRLAERGKDIAVRVPLVAGVNDAPEHMERVIRLARDTGVGRIDLLPCHNWGKPKSDALGRSAFREFAAPSPAAVAALAAMIRAADISVDVGG